MSFQVHTIDSAPEESRVTLAQVEKRFGFVPNVLGILAESPAALNGYLSAAGAFEKSSFNPVERHVVLLAVSFENRCEYCMAIHSMGASMTGASDSVLEALRSGLPLPDRRLEALRRFARAVVSKRGELSTEDLEDFHRNDFTNRHVLEVLTGVAAKTLSNYANHIAHTRLDDAVEAYAWKAPAEHGGENPTCCAA